MALHGESESLGVSWSFEVGLRVQKCAVVLSSSVPSGLTSPCAFLLRLKEMLGLIYCLLGFFARDDYGENTGTGISTWAITFFFLLLSVMCKAVYMQVCGHHFCVQVSVQQICTNKKR